MSCSCCGIIIPGISGRKQALGWNRSDPPLFEVYPEAKRNIVQWCRDNIRDMSCEKLHDYILTHLVPDDLLPKWIESLSDQDSQQVLAATAEEQKCMFLQAHRLSKLSLSTVLRWMGRIGMKYQTKSKSFYVDGHEREVVVRSRTTFVNKYLREWETRCLRFVRLSEEQLAGIPNLSASDCLCSYANDGTILFYEVHEDRLHKLGNDNDIQLQCDDMPRQQSIRATPNQKPLIIVGQDEMIELLIAAILADGHVLIEGVPGVAKTLTAKLLSRTMSVQFSRIQFTPDLMPSDIIGTSIFNLKTSEFEFKPGPLFSNIVLIDEINRAPAKTQSALFEAMEERQITVDGKTYQLSPPFIVLATQNPVEQEGTYRLPEAQLDRFIFKIEVDYPSLEDETKIISDYHVRKNSIDLTSVNNVYSYEYDKNASNS